jgi:hypothetical protein
VKGRTAIQAACNCTRGAHPFDFDASSMEAQAHTSCNQRAGCYVRETAPPLALVPRLLDCGTDAATRGNPVHGPTVPTEHIGHRSVSRGEGATVDMAISGPAVMAAAGVRKHRSSRLQAHVPSWDSERALSHGMKTTRPCSVPRTARAHATAAPRTTRPVALTLRQHMRHLWQAKRATLHLRHNDRVKKGAPRRSISYPFPLPLSLSCYRDRERGYSERDPSPQRKWAPSPLTDQRFEGWPLGRVRQPPQSTRAPRPLLVKGSKAGPSKEFNSRLRPLGPRAHCWSEIRRLAPRRGSTAASDHSGSTPTTDQGLVGWPPKGSDSRLRARRARDDPGYVRYITKARATLPRYPRTFPRLMGTIL